MSEYTLESLTRRGIRPLMRLLISYAKVHDTCTYKQACRFLENELDIGRVFSIHPGKVAGTLMDKIWEYDKNIPPINTLLVRSFGGKPGIGADYYIEKWSDKTYSSASNKEKKIILGNCISDVWSYVDWEKIYGSIFRRPFSMVNSAKRRASGEWNGAGESKEHKRLKELVARRPYLVVPVGRRITGTPEAELPSGDLIDVRVMEGNEDYLIEVKSIKSTDGDLRRGIYQCVKYKAVADAVYRLSSASNKTFGVLVTERELPPDLASTAQQFKIKHKVLPWDSRHKR